MMKGSRVKIWFFGDYRYGTVVGSPTKDWVLVKFDYCSHMEIPVNSKVAVSHQVWLR